ncbi:MAG: hypothetical protein IID40_09315, partial [Planctomycetes bacterium]|nr:hypothetical protein [Planctomycetota bacterium]
CSFSLPAPPVGTGQTATVFACDKAGGGVVLPESFWIIVQMSNCTNTAETGPEISGETFLGTSLDSFWLGPPDDALFIFGCCYANLWNQVYTGTVCSLTCQPGSAHELEACGQNLNGGCNSTPAVFESITDGVTMCGSLKALFNNRDLDWYQLSVADSDGDGLAHITTSVSAELPTVVFVLDTDPLGDGDCGADAILQYSELFADPFCTVQTTGVCVPVGAAFGTKTYTIVVTVGDCNGGIFSGYNCNTSNDYQLTVTVDDNCAATGACCSTDGLNPSCTEVSQAACAGTFNGEGSVCTGPSAVTCPAFADFCADALTLPLNGIVQTDNSAATPQVADPANENGNDPELPTGSPSCQWFGDPAAPHNTIWYKYVADASGSVQINVCDTTGCGELLESGMAIYSGVCGALTELACGEDECAGAAPFWRSQVDVFALTNGETYYVALFNSGSWEGSVPGKMTIEVITPNPNPPPVGGCCVTDGVGGYSCTDGLLEADCNALNGRFNAEGAPGAGDGCATMTPQCGQGACCSRFLPAPEHCSAPFDQANCEVAFDGIWEEGGSCNPSSFTEPCVGQCCIAGTCGGAPDNETACGTAGGTWTFGPTCADDPDYCTSACAVDIGCQTVAYPHGGRTSDVEAGFQVADNFQATASGSITEVCWWGIYFDFGASLDCLPATETWTITYYNDDAGGTIPGTPIVSHVVTPTRVDTGYIVTSSLLIDYRFDATHPAVPVTAGTCYWIEITNNTGVGSTCFWLWANAAVTGDLASAQTAVPGPYAIGDEVDEDMAFCLDVPTITPDCSAAPPTATGWKTRATHDPFSQEGPPSSWEMVIAAAPPRVGPPDPRTDTQIEPRFYGSGGTAQAFLEVVIDLDGAATGAVTVDAVCTDASTHGAAVTVSTDGLTVTAKFEPPLPNTECCTMTLGGGAGGSQVIKILQGDVNGSGRVNATDKNLVKGKITSRDPPLAGDDFFYDINMSGRINATDKNLVKGRVTTANELDQSAGCGLP